MENVKFKELNIADINSNLLDHYNRYQEVKKCYRKEEGNWVIKKIEFIEDWDKKKKENVIQDFSETINNGGNIFAAFDDDKLIGFAVLKNKIFGSRKQYIQLDEMQVSYVTYIGERAFHSCTSLTSITLPEGLISIGIDAFRNCTSLTSITIPANVRSVEHKAFGGWNPSQTIYVMDKTNAAEADKAWDSAYSWRADCNARIVYQGQ